MHTIHPLSIDAHSNADDYRTRDGFEDARRDITITPYGLFFQAGSQRFDLWESVTR